MPKFNCSKRMDKILEDLHVWENKIFQEVEVYCDWRPEAKESWTTDYAIMEYSLEVPGEYSDVSKVFGEFVGVIRDVLGLNVLWIDARWGQYKEALEGVPKGQLVCLYWEREIELYRYGGKGAKEKCFSS